MESIIDTEECIRFLDGYAVQYWFGPAPGESESAASETTAVADEVFKGLSVLIVMRCTKIFQKYKNLSKNVWIDFNVNLEITLQYMTLEYVF